jgi:hypothetical protein
MTCVAAARAYGLDILDGVYNDLGNAEGFAAECRQARDLGFDGKTLIHPRQIEPCNEAFSPISGRIVAKNDRGVRIAGEDQIAAVFDLPDGAAKSPTRTKASFRSTAAWSSAILHAEQWRIRRRRSQRRGSPDRRAGKSSNGTRC